MDINRIRQLLERYYQGATTRGEEEVLEAFFCQTDVAGIPDDMAADMRLFRAMRELHASGSGCSAPDDLIGKLEGIVGGASAAAGVGKRRRMRRIIIWSMSAAACVACAIMVWMWVPADGGIALPDDSMTMAAPQPVAETADGFVEVTDPVEARKILLTIEELLARSAASTNDAIAHIDHTINSYKEISKPISQ